MDEPHYIVKRSTLHCDRPGGRNDFPWNVWKAQVKGGLYHSIGGYRSEAAAQAAVEADRLKDLSQLEPQF